MIFLMKLTIICDCNLSIFLASLRTNPTTVDLKVLFLDDVFVGLDAGNRIPILKYLEMNSKTFRSLYLPMIDIGLN